MTARRPWWTACVAALAACGTPSAPVSAPGAPEVRFHFLEGDADCGSPESARTPPGRVPEGTAVLEVRVADVAGAVLRTVQVEVDPGARCADDDGHDFACPFDVDGDAARERQLLLADLPAGAPLTIEARLLDLLGLVRWTGRRRGVQLGKGDQAVVQVLMTRFRRATCVGRSGSARAFSTVTPLLDGRVLIAGGFAGVRGTCGARCVTLEATASAELYDTRTGLLTPVEGGMTQARALHTATVLPDGRVVVAGGARVGSLDFETDAVPFQLDDPAEPGGAHDTFEVFDPRSSTFAAGGALDVGRAAAAAMLAPDGAVVVAGGAYEAGAPDDPTSPFLKSSTVIEVPATGEASASPGSELRTGRRGAAAVPLPGADGEWLLLGGAIDPQQPGEVFGADGFVTVRDAGWPLGEPGLPNLLRPVVVPFGDGAHVLVGGLATVDSLPLERRWRLHWLDAPVHRVVGRSGDVTPGTGSAVRYLSTGVPVGEGHVMVFGGVSQGEASAATTDTAWWVSSDGRAVPAPQLLQGRAAHASLALRDGTVLTLGGFAVGGDEPFTLRDSLEVLNPGDPP